jgi:hypothetical protein
VKEPWVIESENESRVQIAEEREILKRAWY